MCYVHKSMGMRSSFQCDDDFFIRNKETKFLIAINVLVLLFVRFLVYFANYFIVFLSSYFCFCFCSFFYTNKNIIYLFDNS